MMGRTFQWVVVTAAWITLSQVAGAALVGHWDFEGVVGTTVPDKSGNGLNGEIVDGEGGHVPGTAEPKDTSASVVFNSQMNSNVLDLRNPAPYTESAEQCCGSYVRVADNPLLDMSNEVTMSAWVSHSSSYWYETVLMGRAWDYGIIEWGSTNGFTSVFFNNSTNSQYWTSPSGKNYGVNEWHHVALTYNSATGDRKLYFDGQLDVNDTLWNAGTTLLNTIGADFLIGSAQGFNGTAGLGRSWDGLIDDVRLYNNELTAAEISAVVTSTIPLAPRLNWATNNIGDWAASTNWARPTPSVLPAGTPPSTRDQVAVFGNLPSGPTTVSVNSGFTVNALEFDSSNSYALAGLGTITLQNNTSAAAPTIKVLSGNHQIQAKLDLTNNTTVSTPSGSLQLNNEISLHGHTLTINGSVSINHSVVGGGTVANGGSGALGTAGLTPIGGNLTSAGTLLFDLGPNNVDAFQVAGTASLSGIVDITVAPGFSPSGVYTLLTAAGGLSTSGLSLAAADASLFSISVVGNSLQLTSLAAGLTGDYSGNGIVDAADYTIWRDKVGSTATLTNDPIGGTIGIAQYNQWKANFGATSSGLGAAASVPEPLTLSLGIFAMALAGLAFPPRLR